MRIVFTGGGSGGHLAPIVAVARQLKSDYMMFGTKEAFNNQSELEMFFLGSGSFAEEFLTKEGIQVYSILAGKFRRYFSIHNFIDIFKAPIGLCQTLWHLFILMPDVIFSKGGFDSLPIVFVGWLYRIPVLIHDSDSVPGLANRLAMKFAMRIAVSFSEALEYFPADKTALVGNPVRKELAQKCLPVDEKSKNEARKLLGIRGDKPLIFVLGGSRGAMRISEMLLAVLPELLKDCGIVHQCGKKNYEQIKRYFTGKPMPAGYYLFDFMSEEQMANAYLLAQLVISRAGSSIFEISACGKPSILIPLSHASANHQQKNALAYARSGSTVMLEEGNLSPHLFVSQIKKILDNARFSKRMAENARKFARPDAAKKIVESLVEMAQV